MMTIDEAIKHCDEVAYQNEILMKRYDDASGYNRSQNEKIRTDGAKGCEQLISLYRQLVEWLRELKAYREQLPHEIKETKKRQARTLEVNVANEVYNAYLSEFVKGYICALSFVEGIIAKIIEEVNADDDIHS